MYVLNIHNMPKIFWGAWPLIIFERPKCSKVLVPLSKLSVSKNVWFTNARLGPLDFIHSEMLKRGMGGSGPSGKQPLGSTISGAGPPLGTTNPFYCIGLVIYGCFIFRNGMMIPNDCCIYVCLMVVPPTSIRVQVCGWFPDTRASFDYTLVLRWLSYYVQSLNMIVTSRSFHKFIYMRMKYIQLYIYIYHIYIYLFMYVCIYIYIS